MTKCYDSCTTEDALSYAGVVLRTVALTAVVSLCGVCFAQNSPNQVPPQEIASRIDAIVHRAAEPVVLSSPSSPVKITSAQIFFDLDDVAEIQRYGPRAIPTLSKFILDRNPRIERVAIRLLGVIGGPEIIDPLVEVLDKSTSSGGRNEALLNLKQAPCSKAVARAILRVSQNDSDAYVRDQAREEVSWCSIESAPH
jgi:HEAT repeats